MCPYGKMCIMIFMFLSQLKNTDGRLGDLHISISPYVNCSGLRDGPAVLDCRGQFFITEWRSGLTIS